MNADPTVNVVVFEIAVGDRLEKLVGDGPTRSDDCVRAVWHALIAKHGVRPQDVRRLYSEWEPSTADKAFIDATFSTNLEVTYSFSRPAEGDWEQVMQQVARTIATAGAEATKPHKPWWRFWG
jgi:hypothetical protein